MANYVSNSVRFLGDPAKVAEVRQLFLQIEEKQKATKLYHLPDFVKDERGHMLEIEPNGDWLNYETRWAPNLDLLQEVALHYNLDFIAKYEEPTNWLYGEAIFTNNELHHIILNSFDGEDWYSDPEFVAIQDLQIALLSSQPLKR
ncbi:MAG: DUF1281 family ferredoxin-like fold protein [Mucilaginibacter sp.]